MNSRELSVDEQKLLTKTLQNYFPIACEMERIERKDYNTIKWEHAAPLLAMLLPNRDQAQKLKQLYQLKHDPSKITHNLPAICDQFFAKGILQDNKVANPYLYRLPIIMGEYPRHTKIINQSIQEFNQLIENYHKQSINKEDSKLNGNELNQRFQNIIRMIAEHGAYCFKESLTDLICMMQGYSCIKIDFIDPGEEKNKSHSSSLPLDKKEDIQKKSVFNDKKDIEVKPPLLSEKKDIAEKSSLLGEKNSIPVKSPLLNHKKNMASENTIKKIAPIDILTAKEKNSHATLAPFIERSYYAINRAGRLASKNSKVVVNAFALKPGGHVDGLLTQTPALIPIVNFYSMLWRELSQQMELPPQESDETVKLKIVILSALRMLGMVIDSKTEYSDPSEYYICPFTTQPQAFLTPSSIKKILQKAADAEHYELAGDQLLSLSDYLSHILFRMQVNISSALGIGANDDETVSFSNDGRDYIFQFTQNESDWAARFTHISLHRQGPAQPHMNAAKGAEYELAAALFTESQRMSQLQRSEYQETIYNAIVDNLVAELFPHPDFFENTEYKKFRKHYILTKDDSKQTQLSSYTEESEVGIFKENGQTTPRFRRSGTIDVHALPKDHPGVSESLRSFNSHNPLAAKQFQYAQAMQGGIRGHYIYNPVGPDGFIQDMLNGQLIKNSDGSFVPFIGIIPKNFDKVYKQPTELCSSFVIRMLHSSRLITHCPTFHLNYERIKTQFLPNKGAIPELPKSLSNSVFLQKKLHALNESLEQNNKELSFNTSEKAFFSLFKNIVYSLRTTGKDDDNFLIFHHQFITDSAFLQNISRENIEKVIRILKINAPMKNDAANKDFLNIINYLENLTQGFYPKPSTDTAKKIKQLAMNYTSLLARHADLQDYFIKLQQNPQANLSRTQSPGMIFMKLRGENNKKRQTLSHKYANFDRMHSKNFISGHRDLEGSLVTNPSNVDDLLDWTAKGVAKVSVGLQNDVNPFGQIIATPFIGTYKAVKNTYVKTDSLLASACAAPLGLVSGTTESAFKLLSYGLKFLLRPGIRAKDAVSYCTSKIDTNTTKGKMAIAALFFPAVAEGIVAGLAESTVKLVYDCTISPIEDCIEKIQNQVHQNHSLSSIDEHPLYIPATPDNEPGFKILMSDHTRDTILDSDSKHSLIHKLLAIVEKIISTSHPDFTIQEIAIISEQFVSESILTEKQWHELYQPFSQPAELAGLLQPHQNRLNEQLISAAYRCFLERSTKKRKDMMEEMATFYKLLPEQIVTLKNLLSFYNDHPAKQEYLIDIFSEKGDIRQNLNKRDTHIQTLHDAIMQTFNAEVVKLALYNSHAKNPPPAISVADYKKAPAYILDQIKNSKNLYEQKQQINNDVKKSYHAIKELKIELEQLKDDRHVDSIGDKEEINSEIEQLNHLIIKSENHLQNIEYILSLEKIQRFVFNGLNPYLSEPKRDASEHALVSSGLQHDLLELYTDSPELKLASSGLKHDPLELETNSPELKLASSEFKHDSLELKTNAQEVKRNLSECKSHSLQSKTWVHQENEAVLSIKDRAHLKWNLFATRELIHEFLPLKDMKDIFNIIATVPALQESELIRKMIIHSQSCSIALMKSCNVFTIDAFYHSLEMLKSSIETSTKPEQYPPNLMLLLIDYINVSMNTAVNKLLDTIDEKQQTNPLTESKAIGSWLTSVYQSKDDFRSLLDQQLDQSFLHQSLIRQAYIIHALESKMETIKSDERIHKTGLQKLLRIHYLENNSVRKSGALHYETRSFDDFEIYLKDHGIKHSPTLHYANSRVKTKLGIFYKNNLTQNKTENILGGSEKMIVKQQ